MGDQPDYYKLGAFNDDFNNIYNQQKKKGLTPQLKYLKGESLLIYGDLNRDSSYLSLHLQQ